ncbi:MAG TPA: TIGR03087 family PEP-CTERM/XrtA system glycosyltransferase [Phycisphaerae bacterium]|nr:TIGR03087 family PEP-CTERM/XrtA system glycosyltransferase [Phycisphaerae bacterium]HRW53932.1 TIGR03087 family PEP-CTERM/XrtA system glycosyltransferase [Phycisphaerae bacterium]
MAESKRRKILYLTNRAPYPPDKGDRIRTFHQIDRLALHSDIFCATFTESPSDSARVNKLRRWCRDVLAIPWQKNAARIRAATSWIRGGTLTHGAYWNPVMARQLCRWAERQSFDVVVCFSSIMAPYAALIPAKRRILDLCDVDSEKWNDYARSSRFPFSRIFASEGRRLATYEREALTRFDETIVITQRERRLLDAFEQNPRIHVVSNGVRRFENPTDAARCGPVVGFLGTMDYRPNVDAVRWFADHAWPLVQAKHNDAQFTIIGRSPTREVRRLGRRPGINVTGGVRDMRTHLERCRIVVTPLRVARGLPNKMIEAMAAGRPVVTTSAGADCLSAVPDTHLLVGDSPEAFAASVTQLLRDDGMCRRIADHAYRWVGAHHDWDTELDQFERIVLGDFAASPRSRRSSDVMTSAPGAFTFADSSPVLSDVHIHE